MLSGLKDAREVITEERDNNDGVKRKIDYNVSPSPSKDMDKKKIDHQI